MSEEQDNKTKLDYSFPDLIHVEHNHKVNISVEKTSDGEIPKIKHQHDVEVTVKFDRNAAIVLLCGIPLYFFSKQRFA
jgi:hypothetical protein